ERIIKLDVTKSVDLQGSRINRVQLFRRENGGGSEDIWLSRESRGEFAQIFSTDRINPRRLILSDFDKTTNAKCLCGQLPKILELGLHGWKATYPQRPKD